MRMFAPAKINLTLQILGRRADGFHELATWMLPLDLGDDLQIERAVDASFTCTEPALVLDATNLVDKAIRSFVAATGIRESYRIRLVKRIPLGAGLGGGSSDAAATLRLLNQLHGTPLAAADLHGLAAQLGSDVAFFLRGESAWCTGRGEIMEPRTFPLDRWICLIKPGFGVSTAFAYRAYGQRSAGRPPAQPIHTGWGEMKNDLEPPVFEKYPVLAIVKEWLGDAPEVELALMSGSGSTVFAVVAHERPGAALLQRFRLSFGETYWTAVCRLNPERQV